VQAATNTELIEFKNWALRVRASQSASPRLLVLIHGWTGDENSMWVFTRGLSPDYWMMAPRAPHPAEPSGFSWRPPQPLTLRRAQGAADGRPSLEMLLPAAEALIRLVDEYSASVKLDALQFDLMGFSQGAAMVNLVGCSIRTESARWVCWRALFPRVLMKLVLKNRLQVKYFCGAWHTGSIGSH